MASIYKRGKTWWIIYRVGGKNVCRSLKTQSGRVAEEIKKQYEALNSNGLIPKQSVTPIGPFVQALCDYWRQTRKDKGAETDIGRLRQMFGVCCTALAFKPHTPKHHRIDVMAASTQDGATVRTHLICRKLEDLTHTAIASYLHDRMIAGGITGKTANKIRQVLRGVFEYARKYHGYVCPNPDFKNPVEGAQRFPEKTPPIVWLKTADIEQQLDALKDRPDFRAMVALYIYAGLRREEGLWLTKDDVDITSKVIRVQAKEIDGEHWEPKTRKDRTVPISTKLLAELTAYMPLQKGLWFFSTPEGKRWVPDWFSECLRNFNTAKGLPWSCIEYRHTFGSHLAQKGISLYKISELMGNSPEICRKHYAALMPQEMHDEVEF